MQLPAGNVIKTSLLLLYKPILASPIDSNLYASDCPLYFNFPCGEMEIKNANCELRKNLESFQ